VRVLVLFAIAQLTFALVARPLRQHHVVHQLRRRSLTTGAPAAARRAHGRLRSLRASQVLTHKASLHISHAYISHISLICTLVYTLVCWIVQMLAHAKTSRRLQREIVHSGMHSSARSTHALPARPEPPLPAPITAAAAAAATAAAALPNAHFRWRRART
jgi:hypothetical protein